MSYEMKKRRLETLYRIAIADYNDLDLRYSAIRTMQRIRQEKKQQQLQDIPVSIARILFRTSSRRKGESYGS